MNKVLIVIAVIALSINFKKSYAQVANTNIIISDVLSFAVSQSPALDVNFDTEAKYNLGITSLVTDHISVTSLSGYVVKAIAGTVIGSAQLAPGSIKLSPAIGSSNLGNTVGITYGSAVTLPATGGTAVTIITATSTSWNGPNSTNKFNVSYLIGANGTYAGKATGLNIIPVVYTVIQP